MGGKKGKDDYSGGWHEYMTNKLHKAYLPRWHSPCGVWGFGETDVTCTLHEGYKYSVIGAMMPYL